MDAAALKGQYVVSIVGRSESRTLQVTAIGLPDCTVADLRYWERKLPVRACTTRRAGSASQGGKWREVAPTHLRKTAQVRYPPRTAMNRWRHSSVKG